MYHVNIVVSVGGQKRADDYSSHQKNCHGSLRLWNEECCQHDQSASKWLYFIELTDYSTQRKGSGQTKNLCVNISQNLWNLATFLPKSRQTDFPTDGKTKALNDYRRKRILCITMDSKLTYKPCLHIRSKRETFKPYRIDKFLYHVLLTHRWY